MYRYILYIHKHDTPKSLMHSPHARYACQPDLMGVLSQLALPSLSLQDKEMSMGAVAEPQTTEVTCINAMHS